MCGARFPCAGTDAWLNKCDFLHINLANLHWPRVLLLILVSLLLAMPLASDIDQAAMEEALLDYGIYLGMPERTPHVMLRLGLRIRRRVLPCVTVTAAVTILVISPLDAANILLNLLGIAFVVEAD